MVLSSNKKFIATLLISTFICYLPVFVSGFVSLDDPEYIFQNSLIKDLSFNNIIRIFHTPVSGNYHPLTILTFLFEYQIYGENPLGYHVINLIFHLLNTVLVFLFITKLSLNKWIAFITALLFGLHPMHVESVAWISERKDVLYSFFYLLALITYLDYKNTNKPTFYVKCGIFFIFSCLSKSMAVTLPAILVLIDYLREGKFSFTQVKDKFVFFAISMVFAFIAIKTQHTKELNEIYLSSLGHLMYLYAPAKGLVFYFYKLLFPINLSIVYQMPSDITIKSLITHIALALALLLSIVLFLRQSRVAMFSILFFIISILPTLKAIPVGMNVFAADRYVYLPSIGLFYLIGHVIKHWYQKIHAEQIRIILTGSLIFLIMTFGWLTFNRTLVWRDTIELYEDALSKNPNILDAYGVLGRAYHKKGDEENAVKYYLKAIEFKSDQEPYMNLASIYINQSEIKKAEIVYQKLVDKNPEFIKGHTALALLYKNTGRREEARRQYKKAYTLAKKRANTVLMRQIRDAMSLK